MYTALELAWTSYEKINLILKDIREVRQNVSYHPVVFAAVYHFLKCYLSHSYHQYHFINGSL